MLDAVRDAVVTYFFLLVLVDAGILLIGPAATGLLVAGGWALDAPSGNQEAIAVVSVVSACFDGWGRL